MASIEKNISIQVEHKTKADAMERQVISLVPSGLGVNGCNSVEVLNFSFNDCDSLIIMGFSCKGISGSFASAIYFYRLQVAKTEK